MERWVGDNLDSKFIVDYITELCYNVNKKVIARLKIGSLGITGESIFMPLLLRSVRSGKRKALLTQLPSMASKMLSEALDKDIKPALIKSHEQIVATWKNQPKFQTRKYIKSDSIGMTVFPVGESAEIYTYVDQGTKAHMVPKSGGRIYPVRAKALKFNYGGTYVPKTLANPARVSISPSGGYVSGGTPVVVGSVKAHMVSGIEPRGFSKAIARDLQPEFERTIENTFRRIARKLEE